MIDIIKDEIKSLKLEIESINYVYYIDELTTKKHRKKKILIAKAKIQVLNKIIISYGIQKTNK